MPTVAAMSDDLELQMSQQETVYNVVLDLKESMTSLRFFLSGNGRDIERIRRDVGALTVQLSGVKKMLGKQNGTLDEILRRLPAS